ncbi:hypothetical protein B5V01_27105 [Mesorhizobium erdmanii]|uniref:Uncharacterized protein n=2 Tax=Mesorhizobium TaxID=68287 RepID=A0A3M9X1D7_9HYPH|nr:MULTISPECIES: hypothetical protein [Mesorhizobium]RNJ41340.1 hypothetical protein DNR46_34690 [Mesorhizobium japonicum]RXT38155.1 hypothetical protein B5V01_27105 [Mesorhizobium erdmanii]
MAQSTENQITQVMRETEVEPVPNVDFDISAGVEVLRHNIRLQRMEPRVSNEVENLTHMGS